MASALIAALLTAHPPVGCVIDCSTWHGIGATGNTVRIETLDGKRFANSFEYGDDTDPSSPRGCFKLWFGHRGWEYEMLGEYRFILYGSKAAPLRSVRITPDEPGGWTPTYYFVWQIPPRTAPPPRPVAPKK